MANVPDLYCSEVLPDFDSYDAPDLYSSFTPSKGDRTIGASGTQQSKDVIKKPCTDCCSSLCNSYQGNNLPTLQGDLQPVFDQSECQNISYHDIWCDDNESWTFSSSTESHGYEADESDTCSPHQDSTVSNSGELLGTEHQNASVQDEQYPENIQSNNVTQESPSLQNMQTQGGPQNVQDAFDELQNVPDISSEEFMSNEDIFAVEDSHRIVPGGDYIPDIMDTEWWELSQLSSLSQSSQTSSIDEGEEAQTVPTLRSLLRQHRDSVDAPGLDMDTGNAEESQERRRQLIFNSSCSNAEQVVPVWPTEE